MAFVEESDSKRRRVSSNKEEYTPYVPAETIASLLLLDIGMLDIGVRKMLVPIAMEEVSFKKHLNCWRIYQQEQKKIATINQKYTHFLITDSNETIVGIIINFPGWQLYPFQIVTRP
jgi:hypothetical protein